VEEVYDLFPFVESRVVIITFVTIIS
jgi:hypothetical protein